MSLYYDLVINCDLKEDAPEDAIEAIKYLSQPNYHLSKTPRLIYSDGRYPEQSGDMWEMFGQERFLAPEPEQNVISNFQRVYRTTIPAENNREVYRYRLQYCGNLLHDDSFYELHLPFVYWLATVAYENTLGYYMESEGGPVRLLRVENGFLADPLAMQR